MERAALAVVRQPTVEIVTPVHNEERNLERSVRRLRAYLDACFPFRTTVTIADNASTDATYEIGARLAEGIDGVRYLRISDRERGRAVAAAWLTSRADVVAYIGLDPSAHLEALLPLVAPVASGHSEVACGLRLNRDAVSRAYDAILGTVLGTHFAGAGCGWIAIRGDVARRLVPQVENRNRFFDIELFVLAQRAGLRIAELRIDWAGDGPRPLEDLAGVWRLLRSRLRAKGLKVMTADGA